MWFPLMIIYVHVPFMPMYGVFFLTRFRGFLLMLMRTCTDAPTNVLRIVFGCAPHVLRLFYG